MRLRRLLAAVVATTAATVISIGALQPSAGAQSVPDAPSVSNIPASPVYGSSFLATIATNSDGTQSVTSGTLDVCTVGSDLLTVSFVGVGTCTLTAHTSVTANFVASDGGPQTFTVGQATPSGPTISNVPDNATVGSAFVADVTTDGDGATSVTSNTTDVCTVGGDGLTVSFVATGTCSLSSQVAAGTNYAMGTGSAQTFAVRLAPTAPVVTNLPPAPSFGDSFTAQVQTTGDGTTSVTTGSPSICTVGVDGVTVTFVGVGTCSLTAHVSAGAIYGAADGSPQQVTVSQAPPSPPTVTNIPASPVFGGSFPAQVDTSGDGTTSVTSSTEGVCTVGGDGLTVSFAGVGTCSLTAHVAAGTDYQGADGTMQSFSVSQAPPSAPFVSNVPPSAAFGDGFSAIVDTDGDGATSVSSGTLGVCTVGGDGLTVSFVGVGTCSLTAHVSSGTNYGAADGSQQSFGVGQAVPSSPVVANMPASSPPVGGGFTAQIDTSGDGTTSVTSSTQSTCTVGGDGLTVSFVGVGTCSLTAHVAAGIDYEAADGNVQSVSVGQATPTTPSVSNIPGSATFGGGFSAIVSTNGDGATSVTSSTQSVCTVGGDGLTVSFVGAGTCTLTAHVAAGTDYKAGDGSGQSFPVGRATPSSPSITNLPVAPIYGSAFTATVTTTGDGGKTVSSSTPATCTVSAADHLTVSFVGVGLCTLTAHVGSGVEYAAADGAQQGIAVGRANPTTPVITNIPGGAVAGGSFVATVATNGDGPRAVTSQTPAVCTVGADGLTVVDGAAGTCTLNGHVGTGSDYNPATGGPQSFAIAPQPRGYWLVGTDGGIFSFGAAAFHGSMGGVPLQRPVVGITPTASRNGYWLVATDGGIFAFGDSSFYGSIPGLGLHPAGSGLPASLNAPIVGMVPSSTGHGYFMVASDGGVFAFGDARFEGSCPGIGGCAGAAVAVMPDHSGNGYWLVTSAGTVYAFGDAPAYGSQPPGGSPVVSAVVTPDGLGYWIVDANGAVWAFGDAGSMGQPLGYVNVFNPATAIFSTSDGRGYWVAAARGDVFSYGDAPFLGSMSASGLNGQIIAGFGF